jgi:acetylglutamate kinase
MVEESQRQNGSKYGLVPEMIDGRRITDAPLMWRYDLCRHNKNIVAQLQAHNTNAMVFWS